MSRTIKRTLALALTCSIAVGSLAACGSGQAQCLDDAQGYLPEEIDGKALITQDRLNDELRAELEREEVSSIASGYVKSDAETATTAPGDPPLTRPDGTEIPPDDPTQRLPEVFVMAAVGDVGSTREQLQGLGDDADASAQDVTIEGVDVMMREFKGQSELNTGLAIGQPCDTVVLIVFAFTGGAPAAESAMRQMLQAAG